MSNVQCKSNLSKLQIWHWHPIMQASPRLDAEGGLPNLMAILASSCRPQRLPRISSIPLALIALLISGRIGTAKFAPGVECISWKLLDTCMFSSGLMSCKQLLSNKLPHCCLQPFSNWTAPIQCNFTEPQLKQEVATVQMCAGSRAYSSLQFISSTNASAEASQAQKALEGLGHTILPKKLLAMTFDIGL